MTDNRLIDSDELHYLRWVHQRMNLFVMPRPDRKVDVRSMNVTYEMETNRRVPSDYSVMADA